MPLRFFTERNILLLAVTMSLVFAWALRHPLFIQIAAGSLFALIYSAWQAFRVLDGVAVTRKHRDRAFQGNTVGVTLQVRGTDKREAELVRIEENFPPATSSKVRRLVEHPLVAGRVVELSYIGTCDHRRGAYILGPVKLDATDSLGLFNRVLLVDCFTKLTVYPQAVDLQEAAVLGEGVLHHVGLEVHQRRGISEEFLGIREYRHGDPPRFIDWKSSARQGKLMTKEFEEEVTTLVTMFLDLGKLGMVGVGDQTSVEYSIRCCASLAKRTNDLGHQLQYFGISNNIDRIPLGTGIQHLLTILDRLAYARAEGESAFPIVVLDLTNDLPIGSTAIMVLGAATVDEDRMATVVNQMLGRKILPIIVLIDDRAFIKIYKDQEERHYAAAPLEDIAKNLRTMGARVHIVRREKNMEQALLQSLEREVTAE